MLALILNPRTDLVSSQSHVVSDDLFTIGPLMNKSQVRPNWADLVKNFWELVMDEQYDLAATWLFPEAGIGDIESQLEPSSVNEASRKASSIILIEASHEMPSVRDESASIPLPPTSQTSSSDGFTGT